jgi:hypothetical protein
MTQPQLPQDQQPPIKSPSSIVAEEAQAEALSALERVTKQHHDLWRRFAQSTGAQLTVETDKGWDDLSEPERTARLRTMEHLIRSNMITYGGGWGGKRQRLQERVDRQRDERPGPNG